MRKPARHLRKPLPSRKDVPLTDTTGRRQRGRAPQIRRLYVEERCNVAELTAWFDIWPYAVSYALRNKSACSTRDRIGRAFRRWLAGVGDPQARAAR